MYKIVFVDVDGTLLNSEHKITPLTLKAIKELEKKDIPFVIVSGRGPSGIYPILDEYNFKCPIIPYGGALILDENKNVLFNQGIAKIDVIEIVEFIENNHFDMTWSAYSLDGWLVKDKNDPRVINEENVIKAQSTQGSIYSIKGNEVNKILCMCNPDKILDIEEKLKKAFPNYSIVKSSDIYIEIMHNGITKATAINTLCSLWNIDIADTIAFGDNYNDVEMLEAVGLGVLMDNAPDDLKKKIKTHTYDNNHDGIYHALLDMNVIDK